MVGRLIAAGLALATAASAPGGQDVTPYPLAPGAQTSAAYRVFVDEVEAPVEALTFGDGAQVASWACRYPVRVRIEALDGPLSGCLLRPLRRAIAARVKGREAAFELAEAGHLLVEVEGKPWLCLFADGLEDLERTACPKGAVTFAAEPAEGLAQRLQQTVRELAAQGGGTLHFPRGYYDLTAYERWLEVPAGVNLHLAAGAKLNVNNLKVTCDGTGIFGQGVITREVGGPTRDRKALLTLAGKGARLDGIRLHTAPRLGWTVIVAADDARVTNVKVVNPFVNRIWANDGINVINASRVRVDRFFFIGGDDAVAVKAYKGDAIMRDIEFRRVVCLTSCGAAKIGSESHAREISGVTFRDFDVLNCGRAAIVMLWDPVEVRGVRFEDFRVERCGGRNRQRLIDLVMGDPERSRTNGRAVLEDVEVAGFTSEEPSIRPLRVAGFSPERPVRNVTFRNLRIAGKAIATEKDADFEICFARNVRFVTAEGREHTAEANDRPPVTGQYDPSVHGVSGGSAPGGQPPGQGEPPAASSDR